MGPICRLSWLLAMLAGSGCSAEPDTSARVAAWTPSQGERPPDIVLISIDSLRPDHLGCYGYARPTSPTIDQLAAQGLRFETALSTTSWTLPAHAALFTGLFDSTHGVVNNHMALADEHETLAERLKARGYQTAGFYGGPYLDSVFGFAQGFDHYESCMSPLGEHAHADITGPRTIAAVERHHTGLNEQPLFCFVHLWDVHYDYLPPRQYVEQFSPNYAGSMDFTAFDTNPAIHEHMAPRDRAHLIALYDAEIRSVDDQVRDILSCVARRGRLEQTLVVITADHGEEFFEHGKKGHQSSLFEEQVRIPLILHWPAQIPAGLVARDSVRIIDIAPTLANAAGALGAWRVQGRDLQPAWRGQALAAQPQLLELLVDTNDYRALRSDPWKVLDVRLPEQRYQAGYHLVRDPRERRPIGLEEAWVGDGLRQLNEVLEDGAVLREKLGLKPRKHSYGPELQKRLGFLGYTESAPAPDKK